MMHIGCILHAFSFINTILVCTYYVFYIYCSALKANLKSSWMEALEEVRWLLRSSVCSRVQCNTLLLLLCPWQRSWIDHCEYTHRSIANTLTNHIPLNCRLGACNCLLLKFANQLLVQGGCISN